MTRRTPRTPAAMMTTHRTIKRRNFKHGEPIHGLLPSGEAFTAGHDFGGPFLIAAAGLSDAGGLIFTAMIGERMFQPGAPGLLTDAETARRWGALYRLLLAQALIRGFRQTRAIAALRDDEKAREGDMVRQLCAKAGRFLTPEDVGAAFIAAGLGGVPYMVARDVALRHHQAAKKAAMGRTGDA